MKRFFVLAVALIAWAGSNAWSQEGGGGGSGGAGASGGAGGAGASGAAGAAAPGGSPGSGIGAQGTPGTAASGIGTQALPGTAGSGFGTQASPGAAGSRIGTQASPGTVGSGVGRAPNPAAITGFNTPNQNPFFADPRVQQELRMNNTQFNQLNRAFQRALQRFNRNVATLDTAGGATSAATGSTNRATRDAVRRQQLSRNDGATATGRSRVNDRIANRATGQGNATISTNRPGTATVNGTANAQNQLSQSRFAQLQNQFNTDFNTAVDATFTDPALRERFNQLNLQSQGLGAFNDPLVQQRLSLSPQQRSQLATLDAQWRQQLMALQDQNRGDLTQEEFDALRARFMNQLETMLTPEQLQLWNTMLGETFDFPVTAFVTPTNPVQTQSGSFGEDTGVGTATTTTTDQTPGVQVVPRRTGTARGTSGTRGSGGTSTR